MAPSRLRSRLAPGALSLAALCCSPAPATAQQRIVVGGAARRR